MPEDKTNTDDGRPLVERWLEEQQRWQKTVLTYLDSMVKDDDFLVHLGNAMRGSLLAGKPYPSAPLPLPGAAASTSGAEQTPDDDRLDRILFTLHQIEGQLEDLRESVDELKAAKKKSKSKHKEDKEKDKSHKRSKHTARASKVKIRE